MRSLTWLKRLFSSESGNVLAIGAATMPLLIGSAAFGVDTIQLSVWKRQLQRAADSSAIAGAYALGQNADTHEAVHHDLDKNSFPLLSREEDITVAPRIVDGKTVRAVTVELDASRTLPFLSIFTGGPSRIVADATAALVDDGTFCMVSLYDGTNAGIDINGNAQVKLGCGMKTNATGENSVTAGGASSVLASPIAAVGGIDGASQNFVQPTTIQPYSAQQVDPLAYLADPSPNPSSCTTALNVDPGQTVNLSGNLCFSSAQIQGNLTIAPGSTITVYGGDTHFNAQAVVNAPSVSWVMTGPSGAAGDLTINGGAKLIMSSGNNTQYPGVLFYRDRRASTIEVTINGNSGSELEGALYFPTSDLKYVGNANMDVTCLQMVGRILKFHGSATITNICDDDSGASAFQQTVVRLVA